LWPIKELRLVEERIKERGKYNGILNHPSLYPLPSREEKYSLLILGMDPEDRSEDATGGKDGSVVTPVITREKNGIK
jgi:hypothetical protein